MGAEQWRDVEIVYANCERGQAKAAYAGAGWVDVIAMGDGIKTRFWVKSDGCAELPFNPVRLAEPWAEYVGAS